MRVLVACEFSGIVRDAFIAKGHDAWSCDLLPTTSGDSEHHFEGSVEYLFNNTWDLMIAHPPCTYLTCAGNKWFGPKYRDRFPRRQEQQEEAVKFFLLLADWGIPKMCIENPVGIMSTRYRKPDQIIQPYQFGHDARKTTCLWLRGLPKLKPTKIVEPTIVQTAGGNTMSKWHVDCGHYNRKDRARLRSITFQGIANAMADQWGSL